MKKTNTRRKLILEPVFGIILLSAFFFLSVSFAKTETSAAQMETREIGLTHEEEAWVRDHQTIRVGMSPVFPPLKFSENDVIKGIEPDYLSLLSELTGIQIEYVICDFSVMDAKVKSGQMDMFISFHIPERLAYMMFTDPLMEFKQVIITRADAPFMSGIGALKGKKVAAVKGVKLYEKLLAPYSGIEMVQVSTMEEMFKAVSEFKADALISRTYFAGYVMQNYPNLKITGVADLPPEPYLYAVRKDYPELVAILNKAIASISREQHDAIVQKWFNVRIEYRSNWSEILKWAFVIGGVFTLLLGLSLLWNRRLAREVTERKRAQELLRNNKQELLEKNAELTRFSRAVSHDLRSPVVTILVFLGYLDKDIQSGDPDRIESNIGFIRTAAEKMASLLDELRDLSRIGCVKNDPVETPLQNIVREALALVAGRIAEKGVRVIVTEDPVILFGDRSRLVEVFQNLIDNAVKFTGDQAAPCIEIGAEKSGDEVVLLVRDSGIGIDPQHREKIFDLFEKLDPQTDGTGMGLALVKRIVEVHGGGIRVESDGPGFGACFRFTLAGTRM